MTRLLPALAALSIATPLAADPPRVMTDIPPIHSLVAQVMQGVGEPDLLIPATSSPHDYAMRPSDAGALSAADLVVTVGPGLTPWLEGPLDSLAEDAHRLVLMDVEGMTLLDYREGAWFAEHDHDHDEGHDDHDHDEHAHDDHDHAKDEEHAHDDHDHAKDEEHAHDDHDDHDHGKEEEHASHDDHDHAKDDDHAHDDHDHASHDDHDDHDDHDHAGHDHGEGHDPHIWLDPFNGAVALAAIAEELAELDPDNAATYRANAAEGQAQLDTLFADLQTRLAPASDAGFIVFHDAYHYFEARFDVEASGSVNPSDAAAAGAARIAELRENLGQTAVKCAFSEPQMNQSLLETVVEGQEVQLSVLDPLGVDLTPGPALYGQMITGMADAMADCLSQ